MYGLQLLLLVNPLSINQNCSRQHFYYFYFYVSKKIRLDISCKSSAKQRIHMKYQALFYQKNNENLFKTVVCCSRDWRFKG